MKTVPMRELQQHAPAVVRRVREGESVGITDRGALVAVLYLDTSAVAAPILAAGCAHHEIEVSSPGRAPRWWES